MYVLVIFGFIIVNMVMFFRDKVGDCLYKEIGNIFGKCGCYFC